MWRVSLLSVVAAALLLCGTAQAADPSLVGWWQFNEGSGLTAADSSGNKNNGTLSGPVTWAPSWDGTTCISFNGPYNFVRVADAPSLDMTDGITIAAWVFPKWTGNNRIMQKSTEGSDDQYRLLKEWGNYIKFDLPGVGTLYPQDTEHLPPKGEWTHMAATYDGKAMALYFNAKVVYQQAASGKASVSTGPLFIGTKHSTAPAGDEYNGLIDDVRLYNRGLSAAEIRALVPLKLKAYKPEPADGAIGVTLAMLKWVPGETAVKEEVYVGESPDALVKKATLSATKKTYVFSNIEPGKTYYWRIDDIDATKPVANVYKGDVWSFSVAPLSAYNPTPADGDKWRDLEVDVSWLPGQDATEHKVYFGTDKALVEARDASVFKGSMLGLTFDPGTLALQTTYYWAVDETTSADVMYPGPVWSFTTVGAGGGLLAEYYSNLTLTGVPSLIRVEPKIDFAWGANAPAPGVAADFSVRFSGEVDAPFSETYTFYTNVHGAVRLVVNGEIVIENWMAHHMTIEYEGSITLQRGRYPIVMEFSDMQWGGAADACTLSWSSPSIPKQVMTAGPLQPPLRAKASYPQDNDVNVPQDVTLAWSGGLRAVTHDVYFGADKAAVEAATPADAAIYKGSQAKDENTFTPGALAWNKTYYWRVDEVNTAEAGSPWKGSVWSFTTADFLIVDNFDSYTDDVTNRVFQTWLDGIGFTEPAPGYAGNGTGSAVGNADPPYAENQIVRSGQSMTFAYSNAESPFYSETERSFASAKPWNINGLTTMVVWFQGYPPKFVDDGTTITMSAAGDDIWNNADAFRFAYKKLNGDGSMTVKVNSLVNTNGWAKAGVMIRDSLAPGSSNAANILSASNGVQFQYRAFTDDVSSTGSAQTGLPAPYWVRLTRTGNTFKAEMSVDGKTWASVGTDAAASSHDVTLGSSIYIGLCLTSHNTNAKIATTAVFSDIKTTGGVSGSWQVEDVGITHPGNDAETLYVAIQDGAGKVSPAVTNDDPKAVQGATWTKWSIPLSKFTGVNLGAVKKVYIGVGDRKAPKAGGAGTLFFDDIQVIK